MKRCKGRYRRLLVGLTVSTTVFFVLSPGIALADEIVDAPAATVDTVVDPTSDATVDTVIDPTSDATVDTVIDPTSDATVDTATSDATVDTVEPTPDTTGNTVEPTSDAAADPVAEVSDPASTPIADQVSDVVDEPILDPVPESPSGPVPEAALEPFPEVVSDPVTEVVSGPVPEAALEPFPEVVSDPVTEVVSGPVPEAALEPFPEVVSDPVTELVTDPIIDSVTDPITDVVTDPIIDPVTAAITDVVADPITEVVSDPVPEVVTDPTPEVVTDPITDVVSDPIPEVVSDPIPEVVTDPITDVVSDPIPEVVSDPIVAPVSELIPAPVATSPEPVAPTTVDEALMTVTATTELFSSEDGALQKITSEDLPQKLQDDPFNSPQHEGSAQILTTIALLSSQATSASETGSVQVDTPASCSGFDSAPCGVRNSPNDPGSFVQSIAELLRQLALTGSGALDLLKVALILVFLGSFAIWGTRRRPIGSVIEPKRSLRSGDLLHRHHRAVRNGSDRPAEWITIPHAVVRQRPTWGVRLASPQLGTPGAGGSAARRWGGGSFVLRSVARVSICPTTMDRSASLLLLAPRGHGR
jgi:hypothetical protein